MDARAVDEPDAKRQKPENALHAAPTIFFSPVQFSNEEKARVAGDLANRGYAIIRCIESDQAAHLADMAVGDLTQINANWPTYGLNGSNGCGIVKSYRLPGQMFAWISRHVVTTMLESLLFDGEECCCGIDAVAFSNAVQNAKPSTLKPHVDISPGCPSDRLVKAMREKGERLPYSIQTQLALVTCKDKFGPGFGPAFLAGPLIDELVDNKGKGFTIVDAPPAYAMERVELSPGELLLWRSDMIHGNTKGEPPVYPLRSADAEPGVSDISRLGVFVSVCPKAYRPQKELKKKIQRAELGFCSTHSPNVLKKDGAESHMSNPKDTADLRHCKALPALSLTDEMRRLM